MKDNAPQGGFWMLIEEINDDATVQFEIPNTNKQEAFKDSYDFYPDAGF